jgi:hypothetical protein
MNDQNKSWEPEIFTLDEIVKSISDFEQLLRQKQSSILLPPGSPIETAGLAALEMLDTFKRNVPHDTRQDHRTEWRQAIALADMLRKVLRIAGHPRFDRIWPHVLLLLGNTNTALNVWNRKEDQDANKIFELYMALVLAPLCPDLELEDPKHSAGGKNPDVIAPLNGSRWAFACKVMHSASPNAFIQRVREGVKQIQDSDAEKGIVVISLKNLLQHDFFWTMTANSQVWNLVMPGPVQPEIARRMFVHYCKSYHHQIIQKLLGGPAAFNDVFKNTKAVPAVLLHLCSTICVVDQEKSSFHFLRMFGSLNADPLPRDVQTTLEKLNNSLHGRFVDVSATNPIAADMTNTSQQPKPERTPKI